FVKVIEESLGRKAECNLLPRQPGDVEASLADIGPIGRDHGWSPQVRIEEGIPRFIAWFEQWRQEHPD
ncbi:MAG: hypothetical protein MK085_06020, partial [Phycisphaerales bacterium]|nr:hypothetical protein [Phycisphaerales bacterium]